ncbi:unnamed protein product [Prorocentrum cordatum]|uniref:Uncharacterized protein n=1 Tax=Prorocentrum cordatum TaxID=2364126 RepID=A0ABN9W682_9DINO|nr:unnamed protein product [Polarella glacialis]
MNALPACNSVCDGSSCAPGHAQTRKRKRASGPVGPARTARECGCGRGRVPVISVHGFNNRRGNGGERDLRPRPRFRLRPPTLPVEQKKLRRSGARARHGEPLRHFFARKAKRERGGRAEEQTTEAQIEQERNEAAAAALHKGSGRGSNQGVKWGTPFKQTARHHSRRGARTAGPFGQCPCAALAIRQRGTIIGQFAVHQQAATSALPCEPCALTAS